MVSDIGLMLGVMNASAPGLAEYDLVGLFWPAIGQAFATFWAILMANPLLLAFFAFILIASIYTLTRPRRRRVTRR